MMRESSVMELIASKCALLALAFCVFLFRYTDALQVGACNFTRLAIEPKAEQLLSPLLGLSFFALNEAYNYTVTICGRIQEHPYAGAVQWRRVASDDKDTAADVVMGRVDHAGFLSNHDSFSLVYFNGDPNNSQSEVCSSEARWTNLTVLCDPEATTGALRYVGHKKPSNASDDCMDSFELRHVALCSDSATRNPMMSSFTFGTFLIIVLSTLAGIGLLLLFACKRYVMGAHRFKKQCKYEVQRGPRTKQLQVADV